MPAPSLLTRRQIAADVLQRTPERVTTLEPRVRETLSWYGSDNPGTLTNLASLLNQGRLGGSGRLVILPWQVQARGLGKSTGAPAPISLLLLFPVAQA